MQNLSTLLINNEFINELDKVSNYNEFITLINKYEKQLISNEVNSGKENSYDVVAVTTCPTGIAHTFMVKTNYIKKLKIWEFQLKLKLKEQKVLKIN
ncbi:hypothetical protein NW072_03615 [Mycoplasmopsis felis]|uniref:hypothetical protein n=1 Tax=Mycoplasmopsis felis TaxID=33923 RepID=UPI0021B06BA2|nr:hypothetical protein [Mycoplasmopsis felis]UWV79164.1 hypothetical protein NW072_03615 [Mycoplasmopsis felis]